MNLTATIDQRTWRILTDAPIELAIPLDFDGDQPDAFGLHSDRFSPCFGALLWLAQEAYLRYASTIRQEAIDAALARLRQYAAKAVKRGKMKPAAAEAALEALAAP